MKTAALTITSDFTKQFEKIVAGFKSDNVLVGIPETTTTRKDDNSINNATILAINVFGSPINNIPPRDVMTSGIANAKEEIAEQYKKAAIGALSTGFSAVEVYYNRAGIIASNSIKKAINDQDWKQVGNNAGPAESTLAARKAKGFSGTKSLIVTGQLRNAITYVVKGDA